MKNSNEVKSRIKSIKDTSQITRAMNLISTIKMRKAMAKYEDNKEYTTKLKESIKEVYVAEKEANSKYFNEKKGDKVAYIVVASDRGLAGDYNDDVFNTAYDDMQYVKEKKVYPLGFLSEFYFQKRDIKIEPEYLCVTNSPNTSNARRIMYNMVELYDDGIVDEIRIVYTSIKSLNDMKAVVETILPISFNKDEIKGYKKYKTFDYTCDYKETLSLVVKQYVLGKIYSCLLQAEVAEHYHRMIAMDSATRNSKEILEELQLEFNKIRQEKITKEITETSSSRMRME